MSIAFISQLDGPAPAAARRPPGPALHPAPPRPPEKDATKRTRQPWNRKERLLTPFSWGLRDSIQALSLLHEMTHLHADTKDHGYARRMTINGVTYVKKGFFGREREVRVSFQERFENASTIAGYVYLGWGTP